MVGAIGFEPSAFKFKQTEVLARLGWQTKNRNGSQRNNYWTRIGHSLGATNSPEQYPARNRQLNHHRPGKFCESRHLSGCQHIHYIGEESLVVDR